ncbi:MAG: MarC family protein [Deltaproteobacteria bacterium]|nr:MarC family protein [Deltaproteobacteria bacterium]MCL5277178.1 MarC family protein [Deltaproteobacteria bacterium]
MVKNYVLAIIPIFVAIDIFGLLPIFMSLTPSYTEGERRGVVRQSTLTAFLVSVSFIVIGKVVFAALGITIPDFQIAGGVLLLILSINDIIYPNRPTRVPSGSVGIVPIGIPLITGPAVLTTSLLIIDLYGIGPALVSLALNMGIVYIVLRSASAVVRLIGEGGTMAIGKVASILLASIGVMLVRMGIQSILLHSVVR